MDSKVEAEISPFLPKLLLGHGSPHSGRKQTGTAGIIEIYSGLLKDKLCAGTDPRSLTEWEISLAAAVHILNELSGTSRPPPAEVPLEKA